MTVYKKEKHRYLINELQLRFNDLMEVFSPRELSSPREGCPGRQRDVNPSLLSATVGNDSEIRMAADDFKTILAEIRRCK